MLALVLYLMTNVICGGVSFVFGSAYINPGSKKTGLDNLATSLGAAASRNCPIIVGGDFNMAAAQLLKGLVKRGIVTFHAVPISGSSLTHKVRGIPVSSIDYLLVDDQALQLDIVSRVESTYDFSDHYPVLADVSCGEWEPVVHARRPRIARAKLLNPDTRTQIRTSNYWSVLDTSVETERTVQETEVATDKFFQVSSRLLGESAVQTDPTRTAPKRRRQAALSNNTVKLIRRRRVASQAAS